MIKRDQISSAKYVIVTSDEPWSDVWHTQLHYAYQLSLRYKVIFMNPPNAWKFSNLFNFKIDDTVISEHLSLIRYHNFLPTALGRVAVWLNDKINESRLYRRIGGKGSNKDLLVWHFDPFRSLYLFNNAKKCKHIYHVIDPIAGHHFDKEFSQNADLVIITSPKFADYYTALNANVLQIGQGADLEFYRQNDPELKGKDQVSNDSILLLGTISDDIHFVLLGKLAKKFPVNLVLIGPDKTIKPESKAKFQDLLNLKNVYWLGPMPPAEFRKHIKACRLGIIAYDSSNNIKNNLRSPLKVISYLGCGKQIISNIDCEVPSLLNKAIYMADSVESYYELIEKCYNGKLSFDDNVVNQFLESIDYKHLLDIIFAGIQEPLEPKR